MHNLGGKYLPFMRKYALKVRNKIRKMQGGTHKN